jgi:hypothetical protein
MNGKLLGSAAAGLLTILCFQLFLSLTWESLFAWAQVHQPWILNSWSSALLGCALVFSASGATIALLRGSSWRVALAFVSGVVVCLVAIALGVGLGNLWPIATLIAAILTGVSALAGAALAFGVRRYFAG